jgi:ribosome-associated protein
MRDQDQEAHGNERPEPPSKTKIKQAMQALQDIGSELVSLPASKLEKLPLPEELRRAVEDCRRFTKHGAIRRQLQYIGRLMRGVDAEPIVRQLSAWKGDSDQEKALLHRIERWRERLIEQDDALTDFLRDHPAADATQLRQLVRNARQEAAQGKPPKSSRALFRLIRESLEPVGNAQGN